MKQLAIYVRDTARHPESASAQEGDLRQLAAKLGTHSVRVYRDAAAPRPGSREPRKALTALTMAIRSRHVEAVAVLSLPVIGGSPTALGRFLVQLRNAGVGLLVHHKDPQRAAMEGEALLAAGAHLVDLGKAERRRNTLDGQAHAVALGKHIGRPRVPAYRIEKVRAALAEGAGIRAAARIAGVSPASALRIARERSAEKASPIVAVTLPNTSGS